MQARYLEPRARYLEQRLCHNMTLKLRMSNIETSKQLYLANIEKDPSNLTCRPRSRYIIDIFDSERCCGTLLKFERSKRVQTTSNIITLQNNVSMQFSSACCTMKEMLILAICLTVFSSLLWQGYSMTQKRDIHDMASLGIRLSQVS